LPIWPKVCFPLWKRVIEGDFPSLNEPYRFENPP
jgi:hypothetical protein